MDMKRMRGALLVGASILALAAGAAEARDGEAGPRQVRVDGTVKAVDSATRRFILPVRTGKDGAPASLTDVMVLTGPSTRFFQPPSEGGAAPVVSFKDLVPGTRVKVQGVVAQDGSLQATDVMMFRGKGGPEGDGVPRKSPEVEGGRFKSPEADGRFKSPEKDLGARKSPEMGPGADGWVTGTVTAVDPRRGLFVLAYPEATPQGKQMRYLFIGSSPTTRFQFSGKPGNLQSLRPGMVIQVRGTSGPQGLEAGEVRDLGKDGFKEGPRDGEGFKKGPRDGEGAKTGPRDGDGFKKGPREGEGKKGPREGDQP